MLKLCSLESYPEAQVVVSLLAEEGIEARSVNESLQAAFGPLPLFPIEVWLLRPEQLPDAMRVMADYERRKNSKLREDVACKACGEMNPTNFELCWHCGKPLPGIDA